MAITSQLEPQAAHGSSSCCDARYANPPQPSGQALSASPLGKPCTAFRFETQCHTVSKLYPSKFSNANC